jgi:hypothetical protein
MVSHGIIEDIQEIGRFNYVLLSRSVDFEGYDETQLSALAQQPNSSLLISNQKQYQKK